MKINYNSKQFKIIAITFGIGIITAVINRTITVYKLNEPIKTTVSTTRSSVNTAPKELSLTNTVTNTDNDDISVTKIVSDKPQQIFAIVNIYHNQYPDGPRQYVIVNTDTLSYAQKVALQAEVDKAKRDLGVDVKE